MKKLMYFATGDGANDDLEAYTCLGSAVSHIVPLAVTTTSMFVRGLAGGFDKIVFTHDDTSATTGHRVRQIAKAIAEGANASPHINGMTDMVDLDNSIFYGDLSFITGLGITKGVSEDH